MQRSAKKHPAAGDLSAAILFMAFYICLSVTAVLQFRPLYYFDIGYLKIPGMCGLAAEKIRRNYDILIDYNSLFHRGSLQFPDFIMSEGGRIHFEEVRRIFVGFQGAALILFVVCLWILIRQIRRRSLKFLKLAGIMTVVIPAVAGALIAMNWNRCFVLFHELVFDNDYWIFDPEKDPVINILPDTFFLHCAALILILLLVLALLSFAAGWIQEKKKDRLKKTKR